MTRSIGRFLGSAATTLAAVVLIAALAWVPFRCGDPVMRKTAWRPPAHDRERCAHCATMRAAAAKDPERIRPSRVDGVEITVPPFHDWWVNWEPPVR